MKKVWCMVMAVCLLAGCGAKPTFETVEDSGAFAKPQPGEIRVTLPAETVLPVMETESGQLYICRDYEVAVQTLPGGDLGATVQTLCGFGLSQVEVVETAADGLTWYDFAWSAAGETGDQVGRACIISDGFYHYCLSAMTDAEHALDYQEIWNGMFETFALA